jgi:membrane protease YdiL (CAAX protease family)
MVTESRIESNDQQIKGDLFKFFFFTFAAAWILWFAVVAIFRATASGDSGLAAGGGLLFLPGTFAPALVALTLTKRTGGIDAIKALFIQLFEWRVSKWLYLFAFIYTASVKLIVALLYRIATGEWPRLGQEAWYIMVMATLISMWVQAGEEIGWRGYALPRLTKKFGLSGASIILGMTWACWHLPFFFIHGLDTYHQSFPVYLLQVTAISVAMAWLYWQSKGSILPVMLLHAAVNNTKDIVPSVAQHATKVFTLHSSLVAWLTVALFWIAGVYFLISMRKAKLRNH